MSTIKTVEARHTDEELDSYISINDSLVAIKNEQEELSRVWAEIQSDMDPQPMTLEAVKKVALADQRLFEIRQESIKLDAHESELVKALTANRVHAYAQDLIQRGQEIRQFSESGSVRRLFLAIAITAPMWIYLIVYYILQASQSNQYFDIFVPQTLGDHLAFFAIWATLPFLLMITAKVAIAKRKNRDLSSTISPRDIVFLTRLDSMSEIVLHWYDPEHSTGR